MTCQFEVRGTMLLDGLDGLISYRFSRTVTHASDANDRTFELLDDSFVHIFKEILASLIKLKFYELVLS